jgi:decaprenyl-phosphate phosphoribosyltransferase
MANLQTKTKKYRKINPISLGLDVIKTARPIHWTKNLSIFAALIFSGNLLVKPYFTRVVWAFFIFGIAASATYFFNDIRDAKRDAKHPIKKFRPIASGRLPKSIAYSVLIVLVPAALYLSMGFNFLFFVSIAGYLLIQLFYSLYLKNIAIIDILIIASGFIIRVYAGAFVIDAHLSVWFLLCVISTALFLASGKRRAEIGVIQSENAATRKSLAKYHKPLLDSYVTMFGSAAWMSWALFTFFESPPASLPVWLFLAELSRTTTISKLLMITIPVVIFGIMRYESLIFEDRSEAPEKLLLRDIPLILSIFLWTGMVVYILYFVSAYP